MKIEELQLLIEEGLSRKEIATRTGISLTTVKRFLLKYNLKTKIKLGSRKEDYSSLLESTCVSCSLIKPIAEFYKTKRTDGSYRVKTQCKVCFSKQLAETRQIKVIDYKANAVAYKGGKCQVCGYDRCHKALDFHHIDSDKKEFGIAAILNKAVNGGHGYLKDLHKELDKCVLLCCRCHREFHAGFITLPI